MHSDLIGKIEKARRYAEQPERIQFSEFKAVFNGGNSSHSVELNDGHWSCDCSFFGNWGTCAHVMAMQRMLNPMLSEDARQADLAIEVNEEAVIA
jgi:hypothetical protein